MIARTNPLSLEVLGELPLVPLKDQIDELIERVHFVDEERADWLRKQLRLTRARFGLRRARSLPWKNSSNISIPLIDSTIRRWRPGMSALILDANPIASFTAEEESDFEPARVAEIFYTWYFVRHMDSVREAMELIDLLASRGHVYSREAWKYELTERVRIVEAKQIFPGGVVQWIQQQLQAADPNQAAPAPEELVMQQLAQEYELSPADQIEGPMLFEAAQKFLSGAEYARLSYKEIKHDRADWQSLDPINVIVPPDEAPETASFFAIAHEMTKDQVMRLAEAGTFNPQAAAELVKANFDSPRTPEGRRQGSADTNRDTLRRLLDTKAGVREHTTRQSRHQATVWEIFCHLQLQPGQPRQRCVLWYAPGFDINLALHEYPMPFDEWPVTLYEFNRDGPRAIDNRGIAEMLLPFQKLVNAFHNARIDASQIILSPVFKVKAGADGKGPGNISWRPGGKIPVRRMEDIEPLLHDMRILGALLQEEQVSQRLAETYIGTFDATLTNLEQPRERRTAAEVNAIQNITASIFDLDAKLFQAQLSKSLTKIWQLYDDWGPAELFFRVEGEEKPRLARKSEITRKYDISAAGTPANTNKAIMINNIERMIPLMTNPNILGAGTVDVAELVKMWASLIDHKVARKIIRPPEEAAAVQQVLQAAAVAAQQNGQPPPVAF